MSDQDPVVELLAASQQLLQQAKDFVAESDDPESVVMDLLFDSIETLQSAVAALQLQARSKG